MTTNIFEIASRLKIRYRLSQGLVSTEDLWDLSLPQLNSIAISLRKSLQDEGESFISEVKKDKAAETAFEVVKFIIAVKLEEKDAAKQRKERAEKRQKLLEALEEKQNASLKAKSVEELMKELEALS